MLLLPDEPSLLAGFADVLQCSWEKRDETNARMCCLLSPSHRTAPFSTPLVYTRKKGESRWFRRVRCISVSETSARISFGVCQLLLLLVVTSLRILYAFSWRENDTSLTN